MRGMLCGIASVFLALCAVSQARADVSTSTCKIYDATTAELPEAVEAVMERYGDKAARYCVDVNGKFESYSSFSAVARGRFSVCQFQEIPRPSKDRADIGTFMLVTDGDCPPQSDTRYISAQHVSAGLFVALSRFWSDLSRSEKSFNAAFSQVPADQRQDPYFSQVKERFLNKKPAPRLSAIRLETSVLFGANVGYELQGEFEDAKAITIFVELTDGGLKAMALTGTVH